MHSTLTRWLVALCLLDSLAWGLGTIPNLLYIMGNHDLRMTRFGFRGMEGPFYHAFGADFVFVFGITFIIVSLLKVLAAYWLWQGRRDGAVLLIILLALSVIFWYGFALPFGPLMGLILIVLLIQVRKDLT